MSWTAHRLVLRLRSPLHVGYLKVGNLQRTRPYVPAKTLWGALVARLTRDVPDSNGDYPAMGQRVNDELAFSYFYPAIEPNEPLYPDYAEQGLRYGPNGMSPDAFAWRLLSSYPSTAVDARRTAAKEGSLHETEFISPYARDEDDEGRPVHLVGYLFEHEGCTLPWRKVLDRLQLGGERRYGWGRVALQEEPKPAKDVFGHLIVTTEERPVIRVPAEKPLLAHTVTEGVPARGQVEPLVGRETRSEGKFGATLSPEVKVCWVPGSRLTEERRLSLCEHGVWSVKDG